MQIKSNLVNKHDFFKYFYLVFFIWYPLCTTPLPILMLYYITHLFLYVCILMMIRVEIRINIDKFLYNKPSIFISNFIKKIKNTSECLSNFLSNSDVDKLIVKS